MKPTPHFERVEVLVSTPDDWHPNFDEFGKGDRAGTFVKLLFLSLPTGGWRVLVKGADDSCMERDFGKAERDPAYRLFEALRDGPPITWAALKSAGFMRG